MNALFEPSDLPALSRILLCSDGSTTKLLEALIGGTLTVQVDEQAEVRASQLEPDLRAVLCRDQDDDLVLQRRSRLKDAGGVTLSINRLLMSSTVVCEHGEPKRDIPFGGQLTIARVAQFREQLTRGLAGWVTAGSVVPALFRSYLIHYPNGGRVYVHEHFNPNVVPPARI